MHDAALPWLTKQAGKAFVGEETNRMGTKDPVLSPYQAYPTADGYLNVGCANQKLWAELCEAIDRPDLIDDERFASNPDRVANMDELEEELSAVFRERPTEEWVDLLAEDHGLPVGPVYDVATALDNEQTEARGVIREIDHPALGTVPVIEHPLNYEHATAGFEEAPPLLGEDTEAILDGLGYDGEDIERLREEGAIPDDE
jgi:crotonobetainyl-CoA:carnitine CoA-transferase CaiB-like acyl-CoA transferase